MVMGISSENRVWPRAVSAMCVRAKTSHILRTVAFPPTAWYAKLLVFENN